MAKIIVKGKYLIPKVIYGEKFPKYLEFYKHYYWEYADYYGHNWDTRYVWGYGLKDEYRGANRPTMCFTITKK